MSAESILYLVSMVERPDKKGHRVIPIAAFPTFDAALEYGQELESDTETQVFQISVIGSGALPIGEPDSMNMVTIQYEKPDDDDASITNAMFMGYGLIQDLDEQVIYWSWRPARNYRSAQRRPDLAFTREGEELVSWVRLGSLALHLEEYCVLADSKEEAQARAQELFYDYHPRAKKEGIQ